MPHSQGMATTNSPSSLQSVLKLPTCSRSLASDRRAAERHIVVLQLAILTCERQKQLCFVLNLSRGGMKIRIFGDQPASSRLSVTLRGDQTYEGEVSWRNGDLLGIAFEHELSIEELAGTLSGNGARARGARVPISIVASVRSGAKAFRAQLLNISPSGAAIDLGLSHVPERNLVLTLPGLPSIPAQVRWNEGSVAGVSFNSPLLLMQLHSLLQLSSEMAGRPGEFGEGQLVVASPQRSIGDELHECSAAGINSND